MNLGYINNPVFHVQTQQEFVVCGKPISQHPTAPHILPVE